MQRLVVTALAPKSWSHGYAENGERLRLEVREGVTARTEWFSADELERLLARGWLAWEQEQTVSGPTPSAPIEALAVPKLASTPRHFFGKSRGIEITKRAGPGRKENA